MFNHVCLPDIDFGEEIQVGEDPSFEKKVKEYMDMKEIQKRCEKLYKEIISPRMKATAKDGVLNLVLGDFHLKGKVDKAGSFRPKIEVIE